MEKYYLYNWCKHSVDIPLSILYNFFQVKYHLCQLKYYKKFQTLSLVSQWVG